MKTNLNTLRTVTNLLAIAVIMFGTYVGSAVAGGSRGEHADKEWSGDWFKSTESKKHRSGKTCAKKGCDNALSIPLYVESGMRVGKVTVRLEGSDLKVRYQVKDGWFIKQTNLDVSDSYNGLHVNADGSPDVAAFPFQSKHFLPVTSADHIISASQWPLGTELYIAAQAVVVSEKDGKCVERTAKSRKSHKDTDDKHAKHKSRGKNDRHHGKEDDDHDGKYARHDKQEHHEKHGTNHSKSLAKEAWALGEKFPGQEHAGYFTYKLESCDQIELSTIQFSEPVYSVSEQGPAAVITVVRSGNLDLAASVQYTTIDDTAINGADYVFASGELTFAPGQSSAQFEVTPIDDTDVESLETLTLQLSNVLGAQLGQQDTAILEIEDNDQAGVSVIAIDRIMPNPVEEGNTVVIYVTRSGDLNTAVSVDYGTLDGTAIGSTQCGGNALPLPFDYQHVGGTLFFAAGVAELTIEVTTCNNTPRGDTNETFDIEIYNPMGAELADDGDGNPNSNIETITILEIN